MRLARHRTSMSGSSAPSVRGKEARITSRITSTSSTTVSLCRCVGKMRDLVRFPRPSNLTRLVRLLVSKIKLKLLSLKLTWTSQRSHPNEVIRPTMRLARHRTSMSGSSAPSVGGKEARITSRITSTSSTTVILCRRVGNMRDLRTLTLFAIRRSGANRTSQPETSRRVIYLQNVRASNHLHCWNHSSRRQLSVVMATIIKNMRPSLHSTVWASSTRW